MRASRCLVTGGTGYVGRFIVEALLAAGHDVAVMGRSAPPDGFFSRPVRFISFALDPRSVPPPIIEADYLVHAAFDHVQGKFRGGEGDDPENFRRRNLDGSVALFEAAKAAGVRRAVFLSSRAVYGPRPRGEWLDEADEPRPDTLYGEVKLAAERALGNISGPDFQGISLRVTGAYGPAGPGRRHKWADLFADYLAGRSIEPRVGTEVHGHDVASAVRLVLETAEPADPVLNVSDLIVDRRDLLDMARRACGASIPLPPAADRLSINPMRTERLRALGWRPGGEKLLQETVSMLLRK